MLPLLAQDLLITDNEMGLFEVHFSKKMTVKPCRTAEIRVDFTLSGSCNSVFLSGWLGCYNLSNASVGLLSHTGVEAGLIFFFF